jgi:hypothetical protein
MSALVWRDAEPGIATVACAGCSGAPPSLGDWRSSQNWLDLVEQPVGDGAAAAVPLQVDSAGTGPGWLGAGP